MVQDSKMKAKKRGTGEALQLHYRRCNIKVKGTMARKEQKQNS